MRRSFRDGAGGGTMREVNNGTDVGAGRVYAKKLLRSLPAVG